MIFPSIPQVPEKCYAGPGPGMQANGAAASRKCQHFLDEIQPAACTLGSKDDPRPHWRAPEVFFPMRMSPEKTDFNGFSRPRAGKLCRGLFAHARMFDLLAQTFETGLPHNHAAAPFPLTRLIGQSGSCRAGSPLVPAHRTRSDANAATPGSRRPSPPFHSSSRISCPG